ncbi:MAG: FAD-binding dehydrogenase, partial [Spirochaetia bacterium]
HDQVSRNIGVDNFELWLPERRPGGFLPLMKTAPDLKLFDAEMIRNGYHRPYIQSNCWAPSMDDPAPELTLLWENKKQVSRIELVFDTDYDHAMETVLLGHHDSEMPYCVRNFQIIDDDGRIVVEKNDNYHSQCEFTFESPLFTRSLKLKILDVWGDSPGAVYAFRCYEG